MFLKINNDEVAIKLIGCADGKKQQNWLYKEYITSPTMSTEGLVLSCMIETMEGWDIVTADIPGAFL